MMMLCGATMELGSALQNLAELYPPMRQFAQPALWVSSATPIALNLHALAVSPPSRKVAWLPPLFCMIMCAARCQQAQHLTWFD